VWIHTVNGIHCVFCGADYDGCSWKRDDVARVDEAIAALNCHGILLPGRVYGRLSIYGVRSGHNILWVVGKRVRFQSTVRWLGMFVMVVPTLFRFPHSRSFGHNNLPPKAYPKGFHGSQIPLDGAAVAKACVARLQA